MPSQPRSASFFMKARRSGVSTICAMFSRVGSAMSGFACCPRKAAPSATNSCCSGVKSKSTVLPCRRAATPLPAVRVVEGPAGQLYSVSGGSSDLGAAPVVTLSGAMDFTFSAEQQELREAVRTLAADRASSAQLRAAVASDTPGFDPALWRLVGSEMGLLGIGIDEELG